MHGTRFQPEGSRSIDSSSIPTVQGRAATAGFHSAQSTVRRVSPSRDPAREGAHTRVGAGAHRAANRLTFGRRVRLPAMASGRSDIAERKRTALLRAALVLAVFVPYPILALTTPVLDGTVAGVSVGYLVGFLELMFAWAVALVYVRSRA
jgi:uncharacterized membrane protein (DUF485 family)